MLAAIYVAVLPFVVVAVAARYEHLRRNSPSPAERAATLRPGLLGLAAGFAWPALAIGMLAGLVLWAISTAGGAVVGFSNWIGRSIS
jgi:hypothetical protein